MRNRNPEERVRSCHSSARRRYGRLVEHVVVPFRLTAPFRPALPPCIRHTSRADSYKFAGTNTGAPLSLNQEHDEIAGLV